MKTMIKATGGHLWRDRAALALYHAWLGGLIWVAQYLRLGPPDAGMGVTALILALALVSEVLFSRWFEGSPATRAMAGTPERSRKLRMAVFLSGLLGRVLIILLAFWVLVELVPFQGVGADINSGLIKKAMVIQFWHLLELGPILSPVPAAMMAAIWLALVEVFVIRMRLFRGLLVPVAVVLAAYFLILINYEALGAEPAPADIEAQPGVEIVFDAGDLADTAKRDIWKYSRNLIVDERTRTAWVSFGQTLNMGDIPRQPSLWSISLDTGYYRTATTTQNRAMVVDIDSRRLFAMPWGSPELLEFDSSSMKLVARHEIPVSMFPNRWKEADRMVLDPPYIYISQPFRPAVLKYDVERSRFMDSVDLVKNGPTETGDLCCLMVEDPASGNWFIATISAYGSYLYEMDSRDLRLLRWEALPEMQRYMVLRTRDPRRLYSISEQSANVYEIDPRTLKASRLCRFSYRSVIAYDPWADRLVLVDGAGDSVTIARMDCTPERVVTVGRKPNGVHVTRRGVYVASTAGLVLISRHADAQTSRPASRSR